MDSKSKLPKPSKLRTPSSSAPSTAVKPKIIKPMLPRTQPLSRRSKSMSDLRPTTSKITKQPEPTSAKIGVKRPPPSKLESDKKPKVMKQKVPDWDYKSRFQLLNEKHLKLQEAHKKLKEQVEGIEALEDQHNSLMAEHLSLQSKYNKLELIDKDKTKELERLKIIETDYLDLKTKWHEVTNKNIEMTAALKEYDEKNVDLNDLLDKQSSSIKDLQQLVVNLKQDSLTNENLRRKLHNTIQDLKGNIRVFCRVRPPVNDVESTKQRCSITYLDETSIDIRKSKEIVNSISGKVTECKQEFNFDFVFTEDATQAEFFEEVAQLVQSAIDGYHVCVFAYGQTGSGKTYTMEGENSEDHIGMIPRTVNLLFKTINALSRSNWIYDVNVSFLEIYNENVRDLLDPNASHSLEIYFNEGKGTTVTNLRIEKISSYEDFDHYAKIAQRNRMVAATDFNEHSSRSHAITKIYLSGQNAESKLILIGSINLVDLAGSESAKTSHGDRLVETKSINKSLSTLGKVMLALQNKDKHIPYRDSKLTYLLQSCLGGNSKTMMIVNISPFEDNHAESVNSLRFASKVKEVKIKVKKNKSVMPLSAIQTSH